MAKRKATKKKKKRRQSVKSRTNGRVRTRQPAEKYEDLDPSSSGQKVEIKAKEIFREMAVASAAIFGYTADFNPDDLVINKGVGVKIYQDMIKDPYVKSGLFFKKISVSRLPITIKPASADPFDIEVARFVEWSLENMRMSLRDALWGIMDGVDVGYSISEKIYKLVELGPFRGKITYDAIKSKDPFVYSFEIDDFGNVLSVYQRYGFRSAGYVPPNTTHDVRFPPDKFVIYTFMPKYSNPYGNSDLRAAFRAFFIKDFAWKFRAIYMEKFGMPPIIGKFPNGTSAARRKKLEDVLKSIQTETVITMPEDLVAEVLRIAQSGPTEYERAISDLNKEILVGLLGSFLSVEEGSRTGARAAGQVHKSVADLFTYYLADSMEDVVNRQIVRPLVDLNYNVEGMYPKAVMDIPDTARMKAELEIDKELKEMGVELDESYFYEKYKRPRPVVSEIDRRVGFDYDQMFERIRSAYLPEDAEKIGNLKDAYRFMSLSEGATGATQMVDDPEKVGYDMAGVEREFRKKHGKWMNGKTAHQKFREICRKSHRTGKGQPQRTS